MSGASGVRVLGPALLAGGAAEAGRRLLAPRTPAIEPATIDLRTYFSSEELARGRAYARGQLALGLLQGGVELGALTMVTLRPSRLITRRWSRPVAGGAALGAGLSLALSLPVLPLRALSRQRAITAGLDTQAWRAWGGDLVKASSIQTGFAAAAGAAIVAAARRYPRSWWAPTAAGSVVLGGVLAALAPVLLDPVFNDFEPLPKGDTRADVLALARSAGVTLREVYSVDASRRTTAANAYVTGLGPSKRVVIYDTLLDRYSRDEVRLVVAHELGHVANRDVPRSVLYAAIVAPAAALTIQRLSWVLSAERATPATLPALSLATAVVSAPIGLIANRLSRAIERRADQFSLELAGVPEAFVSFERAIALQNLADLEPPRWVSRLLATHPPTAERIGVAVAFSRRERSAGDAFPPRPASEGRGLRGS